MSDETAPIPTIPTMPTESDREHLSHVQQEFATLVSGKYIRGVHEHGHLGHLWTRAVDREALNEAVDQVVYLVTLIDQIDKVCDLARGAVKDEKCAKDACREILTTLGRMADEDTNP